MMGLLEGGSEKLFYEFSLDDAVPSDHLLRKIDRFLDFDEFRSHLRPYYSAIGQSDGTLTGTIPAWPNHCATGGHSPAPRCIDSAYGMLTVKVWSNGLEKRNPAIPLE